MTTFRAQLTSGDHMWITHGSTRDEALFRMRDAVHQWALTTGNPWPMGEVDITEVAETDTTDTP